MGNTKRNNIQQKQGEWGGRTDAKYSREGGAEEYRRKEGVAGRQKKREECKKGKCSERVRGAE